MWLTGSEGEVVGALRKLNELALLSRLPTLDFPLDDALADLVAEYRDTMERAARPVALLAHFKADAPVIRSTIDGIVPSRSETYWDEESFNLLWTLYHGAREPVAVPRDRPSFVSQLASLFTAAWHNLVAHILWVRVAEPSDPAASDLRASLHDLADCLRLLASPDLNLSPSPILVRQALESWLASSTVSEWCRAAPDHEGLKVAVADARQVLNIT
jgi:hypothetical protein